MGERLEFRVLGPFDLLERGRPLAVPPGKPRALLALLVLRANEVVASGRLVEELWGERPPRTAATALQGYVSQLRKVLPAERLLTRAPGYLLRVEQGELDLDRHEALRARAREAEPAEGARLLRAALALWRGPPLAELAYEAFAREEIARLEELRLATVEERIEADLAAGRAAEIVAELELLTARHPLRERLTGQLMRALYRSGRQAEALDSYQQARRMLVDELGIEPTPALHDLHRAILAHDRALAAPGAAATRPPPRIDLPAPPNRFVGRTRELAEVCAELGRDQLRLLTLTGPGGSGKTRLALQAASERAGAYRDGVRFVTLAWVTDTELIATTIAYDLALTDQPGVEPEETLRAYLAERELLLVLDNVEHLVAGTAFLGGLLADCPRLQLLVTSRQPLHLSAEYEYPVPPLDEDEATELFRERARAVNRDFAPNGEVTEICRRLDALPLAVELAAAHTRSLSAAEILARLVTCLPLLTGGPRDAPARQQTLHATIEWSYELLEAGEQQLLARLAVFAGGFSVDAAESVCETTVDTLDSLVDKSLLHGEAERYRMLETIREYAREQLEAAAESRQTHARHAEYYAGLAAAIDARIRGPKASELLAQLERDHDNLRAALAWLLEEEPDRALRLAVCVEPFWTHRGRIEEGTRWFAQVLERTRGSLSGARAHALREAASFAEMRGRKVHARALVEQALDEAVRVGARHEVAGSLLTLERYDEALSEFRALGDERGIGTVLRQLGLRALDAGQTSEARLLLEETLAICRRQDFPWAIAGALRDLGDCALAERRPDEAMQLFIESVMMARALGSDLFMAEGVGSLSAAAAVRGATELAALLWGALESAEMGHGFRFEGRDRCEPLVAEALRTNPVAREEGRRLELSEAVAVALRSAWLTANGPRPLPGTVFERGSA